MENHEAGKSDGASEVGAPGEQGNPEDTLGTTVTPARRSSTDQ